MILQSEAGSETQRKWEAGDKRVHTTACKREPAIWQAPRESWPSGMVMGPDPTRHQLQVSKKTQHTEPVSLL